ncbi:Hypothetical predicted protein [Mytilus galloprovincialis]|uniref:Uncharacterized protein n=1 Tax=Mytilus galloprovincialis TaxID=29158 RepID=A0A8B6GRX7_MYTGA|nr:Hypothetical predicted protein [Mytilus galloprovincialis]
MMITIQKNNLKVKKECISEEEDQQSVKKGRGRYEKIRDDEKDVQSVRKGTGVRRPQKNANKEYQDHAMKKSPGRLRKNPYDKQDVGYTEDDFSLEDQSDSETEYMSEQEDQQSVKQVRDEDEEDVQAKRNRGRPLKSTYVDEEVQSVRRILGRSSKQAVNYKDHYTGDAEDLEVQSDSESDYSEEEKVQPMRKSLWRSPKGVDYTEDDEDIEEQSDCENEYMSEEEEEQPVEKGRGRKKKKEMSWEKFSQLGKALGCLQNLLMGRTKYIQ